MANQIKINNFDKYIKAFSKSFFTYMNDYVTFSKNYKLLLDNLSPEQQQFLIEIFTKTIFAYHADFYLNSNFTQNELSEQQDIKMNLFDKITQHDKFFKYKEYLLPINHFELTAFYYNLGIKHLKNVTYLKGKDFIDAGAYIGDSALILNKLSPNKIYAFEPVSEIFNKMLDTINLNNLKDVIMPVQLGLSSKKENINIYVNGSSSGTTTNNKNSRQETISTITIDEFVEKNSLDVGLIKMDTEGTEIDILKGSENTIKTQKPTLIISIYHNANEFFEVKPLLESWNLGYKFYFTKLNPFNFLLETTLICEL